MNEPLDRFALHNAVLDEVRGQDTAQRVQDLLDAGADPHALDSNGETPFNLAAANAPVAGGILTRHWFRQAMAGTGMKGLNDRSGSHGSTLAQYMAKWTPDADIAAHLREGIAQGLIVDAPNSAGWTPLTAAAAMGRIVAVKAFLEHYSRAAVCLQTTEDYTAVYNGCPVFYRAGLNAPEVAQERVFQDEGLEETLGEALWECVDILAAAIARDA